MVSQIKAGAVMSYISLFITILIGIIYTPWMISSIGKSDYGLYVLAMSVINIFVFDFGLGDAIQRFVSKYLAEGRLDKVNNFLSVTYKLYVLADIVILIVLFSVYFFIPNIFQGLAPDEFEKFKFIYAIVAVFSILSFPFVHLDGTILAHEKFVQLKLCDLIHKALIAFSMTIFLYYGYGLYALVLVNVFAGIFRIIFKVILLKKYTKVEINWEFWDNRIFKLIKNFSIWITIYAVSQRVVLSFAPTVLGIYHNSEHIAILGISIAVEGYFFLFANAINGLFLPKVSRLISNQQSESIIQLMIRVGRIQIFISGMIYIGLISFGKQFISLWVGEQFSLVYVCSIIMILPSFISLPQHIAHTTILAKSKVKFLGYSGILKLLISLLFVFPLAKYYSVLGVSVSIAIAYSFSLIYNNIVYVRILKINIKRFFLATFFQLMPSFLLAICFGLFINFYLDINGWIGLMIKTIIFVCLYITLFFFLGLGYEERSDLILKMKKYIRIGI